MLGEGASCGTDMRSNTVQTCVISSVNRAPSCQTNRHGRCSLPWPTHLHSFGLFRSRVPPASDESRYSVESRQTLRLLNLNSRPALLSPLSVLNEGARPYRRAAVKLGETEQLRRISGFELQAPLSAPSERRLPLEVRSHPQACCWIHSLENSIPGSRVHLFSRHLAHLAWPGIPSDVVEATTYRR